MKERKDMWVCVETSLSTHLAMPLSPHTTAADLKRQLGKEHSICFPSTGMIKINGLMVKHRSHHYHLPDSITVKDVFQGWERTWFLHVDATPYPSDKPCESNFLAAKVRENVYSGSNVADARVPVPEFKCNTDNKARERKREEIAWSEGIPETTITDVRISEKNKRKNKKRRSRNKLVDGMEMLVHEHGEGQGNDAAEVGENTDICTDVADSRVSVPIFKFNTDDKARERVRAEYTWFDGMPEKTQIYIKIPEKDKKKKERSSSNKGMDGMEEMFVQVQGEGQGIMAAEVRENVISGGDSRVPVLKFHTDDKSRERDTDKTRVKIPENDKKKKRKRSSHNKLMDGMEIFVHVHGEGQYISQQKQSFHCDSWKELDEGGESNSPQTIESPNVSVSEVASLSGLIMRYFPDLDEVKSCSGPSGRAISEESEACGPYQNRTPPRLSSCPSPAEKSHKASGGRLGRTEVGKRILLAANRLKNSASKKKSSVTICGSKCQRKLSSLNKTLVFDVNDSA